RGWGGASSRRSCSIGGRVDRPEARSGGGKIEKEEAKEDCRLTAVFYGKETHWKMHHEIGECRVAREDKRDQPRQEADEDKGPADHFDDAGEIEHPRRQLIDEWQARRKAQNFGRSVLEKEKACYNPEHR